MPQLLVSNSDERHGKAFASLLNRAPQRVLPSARAFLNDQEVSIAIPIGMILELIGQMATAHAKNWEKFGLNMSFAEMLELTGFQAERDQPDTGKIILRLTSCEAAFSFRLSPDIAEALRGELAKVAAVTGQTNKGR